MFKEFIIARFSPGVDLPKDDGDDALVEHLRSLCPGIAHESFKELEVRRVFSQTQAAISYLYNRARDRDDEYNRLTGDDLFLLRYCFFACPTKVMAESLYELLNDSSQFDLLYLEIGVILPGYGEDCLPHPLDDRHLGLAPIGVGAMYCHGFHGGDGLGMRFADMEGGWTPYHHELREVGVTISGFVDKWAESHGNAVLSIVAAPADGEGLTGVAPGVGSVKAFSIYRDSKNQQGVAYQSIRRAPDAIYSAIEELRFGDVLLLEMQGENLGGESCPLEVEPVIYDAIRLATALGIVVVEPAGNGRRDLDELSVYDSLRWWWETPGLDSGAILVAASSSDIPYCPQSNYGRRVNCFAWGENVWAAGDAFRLKATERRKSWLGLKFLDLEPASLERAVEELSSLEEFLDKNYFGPRNYRGEYQCFGGTSAASAIIAGVSLCVQGLAQANLDFRFSPWQLRLILGDPDIGTPSSNPGYDKIGVMPDLKAIIEQVLCLPADVYFRDRVGDVGEQPRTHTGESPDLLVFPESLESPQFQLGEGSGRENDDLMYRSISPGPGTCFYLRLRNRGGQDAENIRLYLFHAPVAPLPALTSWVRFGTTVVHVRAGDQLTVSDPIRWPEDQPAPEESCSWIAVAHVENDPIPARGELSAWEDFFEFWMKSNNISYRNVHVVTYPKASTSSSGEELLLPFQVHGAPDQELPVRLEILSKLPRQARVWLEMPPELADLEGIWERPKVVAKLTPETIFVPVNPNGRNYFRERVVKPGAVVRLRILVQVPPKLQDIPYRIAVRQMLGNEEIGRVTWRLVPDGFGESKAADVSSSFVAGW